jgi:hypothetical protein
MNNTETAMNTTQKLFAVRTALASNPKLAEWYETEHSVDEGSFKHDNVAVYGGGGLGDMADQILEDAETLA